MHDSFKERRKSARIFRKFILTYHEKGKAVDKHTHSQVNNISKGGVNFSSDHPIDQGAVIVINLKTPFISDSIRLEGVVLECKEKIPEMIYVVRLQFQELSRQAMTVLEKIDTYGKDK